MSRFKKHVFICEHKRPPDDPKGCCSDKNSSEIRELIKQRLKELGLSSIIRANYSGCLDACKHGPVIVIYPEQVWYGYVTIEDVEEIIQSHLINNKPVERLIIYNKKNLL